MVRNRTFRRSWLEQRFHNTQPPFIAVSGSRSMGAARTTQQKTGDRRRLQSFDLLDLGLRACPKYLHVLIVEAVERAVEFRPLREAAAGVPEQFVPERLEEILPPFRRGDGNCDPERVDREDFGIA